MRHFIQRLGIPGILAAGLGLFCLSFYAGSVAPAGETLATLDRDAAQLGAKWAALPQQKPETRPPVAVLPPAAEVPALIVRLGEVGDKAGFAIDRAAFRQIDDGKLRRLEVALPFKGSYQALRGFLREAAALSQTVTIEEVSLRRSSRTDTVVDAQIRLSYYFAAP